MRQTSENALAIAQWLETQPNVARVLYPGLPSHPQHELAKRQMRNGFSGIVTFFVKGGLDDAKRFLERLQIFTIAESLGGVESLVDHPGLMTHASIPPEQRKALGIDDTPLDSLVGGCRGCRGFDCRPELPVRHSRDPLRVLGQGGRLLDDSRQLLRLILLLQRLNRRDRDPRS